MATTVLRSPRLETAGPDSPLLRSSSPRVSSPADDTFLSQRYDEEAGTRPSITSKEWKEESCLLMGATDELVDTPLSSSTRRQVAAVGLTMVSVMQVVASKAVLNCISIPCCFLVGVLLIEVALLRLWALVGRCTLPKLSISAAQSSVKLVAVTVLGLLCNTIALQTLDLSFYQIARGLVLPFSSFFAGYIGAPVASTTTTTATSLLVVAGFLLAALAEPASASISVLFSVAGVIATVFRPRFVARARTKLGGDLSLLDLAWNSSIFSLVLLAPLALLVGEGPLLIELTSPMWSSGEVEGIGSAAALEAAKRDLVTFLLGTLLVGCFTFLATIATSCDIKHTEVAISFHNVSLTWLSIGLFADILTPARLVGIMLVTLGSILHVHFALPYHQPLSLPLHSSSSDLNPFPLLDPSLPSSISRPHKPRPLTLSPDMSRRPSVPTFRGRSNSPNESPRLPALGKVVEEDDPWSTPSSMQSTPTRVSQAGSGMLGEKVEGGDEFDKW